MGLLLLPLGVLAGWIAGTAMSRAMIRQEVARLESLIRNGAEKPAPAPPPAPVARSVDAPVPAATPVAQEKPEEVSPDTILILSAAVAAFLGKRARIRSARLLPRASTSAWAQQGRVFVQASHNLGVMHGR